MVHTEILFGTKSSLNPVQLKNKLKHSPNLLELHITQTNMPNLERSVEDILSQNPDLRIVLHNTYLHERGEYMDLTDVTHIPYIVQMVDLAKNNPRIKGVVVHPESPHEPSGRKQLNKIDYSIQLLRNQVPDYAKHIYFETIPGPYGKTANSYLRLLRRIGAEKSCFDISHVASQMKVDAFHTYIDTVTKRFPVYWHISDHICGDLNPDARNIGEGELDLSRLVPHIHMGIVETPSAFEDVGVEMNRDYVIMRDLLNLK